MKIAIIGAGQVGQALAAAFRRGGGQVTFGVRADDPQSADRKPVAAAVADADVAVLAVPYGEAAEILADRVFEGRIVIDATNPLGMGEHGLALTLGFTTSGAEQIAAAAPHVRLVKAFNQTGFENMAEAHAYPARPVMFIASDDPAATSRAAELAEHAGFEAVDLGSLRQARLLEPLAMLWIELARKRGLGADFALRLERRAAR